MTVSATSDMCLKEKKENIAQAKAKQLTIVKGNGGAINVTEKDVCDISFVVQRS